MPAHRPSVGISSVSLQVTENKDKNYHYRRSPASTISRFCGSLAFLHHPSPGLPWKWCKFTTFHKGFRAGFWGVSYYDAKLRQRCCIFASPGQMVVSVPRLSTGMSLFSGSPARSSKSRKVSQIRYLIRIGSPAKAIISDHGKLTGLLLAKCDHIKPSGVLHPVEDILIK